jgi:hypothetical protein
VASSCEQSTTSGSIKRGKFLTHLRDLWIMLLGISLFKYFGPVFARSNAGILCSNPTQGMDVCLRLLCSCFSVCRWRPCDGLVTSLGDPTVCVEKIAELKKGPGPNKGP